MHFVTNNYIAGYGSAKFLKIGEDLPELLTQKFAATLFYAHSVVSLIVRQQAKFKE